MAFNIIGSNASGGTVRYYGGYTYTPSSYPPPSDFIAPVYNNSDSSIYMTYNNVKYYNSAVLNINGSTFVFFFFTRSISCIRGYYNGSAWTTVSATSAYGNGYSVSSIDTISVGGVLIPSCSNLSVGTFIDTDLPVFTNTTDFLNYIKNPVVNYRDAVNIGKLSDAFPIAVNVGVRTIDKTGQQILNYALQRGYNSAMLIPFEKSFDIDYYMVLLCDAVLSNDDIYLYLIPLPQVSNSQFGIFMGANDNVRYLNGEIEVDSNGDFYQFNGSTVNMSKVTYGGKDYRCLTPNRLTPKPAFLTTLAYNHIYLNSNHDITPETYDWESIRSVEGKGKTYKLTKYLNINNGDPVNNVSYVNNVDVSAKSKVNNMVDDVIVDGGKVTVRYTIPAGSYSYIKLVYKKNGIPASYSDGTAVDITQSSTSKVFDRLDFKDTAVYWFAIFTDKSTSEPVSLDLKGYNPVPAEYQDYIDLINGVNFTYKYNLMDNWVTTLTAENAKNGSAPNYATLTEPAKNASYIFTETVSIDTWNSSVHHHLYVSTKENGSYNYDPVMSTGRCDYCVEPFSINIVGSGDSYSYTISNLVPKLIWRHGQNEYTYVIAPRWFTSESKWSYHAYSQSTPTIASRSFSGTLEQCLQMLAMQVRNVDLYVNGELWSRKVS